MKGEKIAAMLAAGLVMGTMIATPFSLPVVEATSESVFNQTAISATIEQADKLYSEERFAEAAELYEKAAEAAKDKDALWFSSGVSYYKAERYDKAASSCKKAIKINPNNGLYYNWCGLSYLGQLSMPHNLSSRTLLERAEEYEERAVELLPNNSNVRLAAARIQASLANFVGSTHEKHLNKAYQHYCKAIDLDPSNRDIVNELKNFVRNYSYCGFQPYDPAPPAHPIDPAPGVDRQPGTQGPTGTGAQGATSSAAELNKPSRLKENAAKLQDLMKNGKMKLYNAGAGFEWWDEEAKADFEALPFSDDIEEVSSHVYQVIWDDRTPYASYVILVPRHVHVTYGPGEEKSYDTLLIVEIAGTEDVGNGALRLTPYTEMVDRYYLKNGRTHEIVHLASHLTDEESFSWKWLEEGRQEVEVQQASSIPMLGEETIYKFEGTNDPNVFIVHGRVGEEYDGEPQNNFYVVEDAVSAPDTWTGKMVALPDIVVPPVAGYGAE